MIIIGACCRGGGVGFEGGIPWKNKPDLRHFRKTTMGKTVLVGRKTYEKMPPLKGRDVVVLSKTNGAQLDDYADQDVMLIGGPVVWRHALEKGYVDRIILTYINLTTVCDAFFPMSFLEHFDIEKVENLGEITCVITYKRKMN